jgi:hypothetical protein
MHIITQAGGAVERGADSVALVSFWNIPCGTAYDLATPCTAYFEDMERARAFERRYSFPPEMAHLIPLDKA